MRFMMILKHAEKPGPAPKGLMDAIERLAEEDAKAGNKMIRGGGLAPTALGARVRLSGGTLTVTDGPFTEAREGWRLRAIRVEVEGRRGRIGNPLHGTSQETLAGVGGRDRGSSDVRAERLAFLGPETVRRRLVELRVVLTLPDLSDWHASPQGFFYKPFGGL